MHHPLLPTLRRNFIFLTALMLFACNNENKSSDTSTPDTDTSDTSTSDTSSEECKSWLVTYNLDGSVFFIDGPGPFDYTIPLQSPYDAPENMGPGTITIRFTDAGGKPGEGSVSITDYSLTQNFVTEETGLTVTTMLENIASDACGVSVGTLAMGTLSWAAPSALKNHCKDGNVVCDGSDVLCSTGGFPESKEIVFDNECGDFAINSFTFTNADFSSFTMEAVNVPTEQNATTTLSLVGTQVSMKLDENPPDCVCN